MQVPICALQGFKRIFLKTGEKKTVKFNLKPEQFSIINNKDQRVVEPGKVQLYVGGRQPSPKVLSSGDVLKTELEVIRRCKCDRINGCYRQEL